MKKQVLIDERAKKELKSFPEEVQAQFAGLFLALGKEGFLQEPFAKRITDQLFEVRIKYKGQWRAVYAYLGKTSVIILSGFQKKTQKMPGQEIKKAHKRLREHIGRLV